jgi:hypothetical protein
MPMNRNLFVVDAGHWGIFTSGPSSDPQSVGQHQLAHVHVDDLPKLLQFVRVTSTSKLDGTRAEHVLVSAYAPFPTELLPDAIRRLSPLCDPASLSLIVEDRVGWARATSVSKGEPEAVAAVVAYSKASGSWDDSDPIVVEIDDKTFSVSPTPNGFRA